MNENIFQIVPLEINLFVSQKSEEAVQNGVIDIMT